MSRLWDTPEYWVHSEADEMLREMNDVEPGALADSLEQNATYDGDPELAAAIVDELRRRAVAGVRFWSGSRTLAHEPLSALAAEDVGALIDDEIPW